MRRSIYESIKQIKKSILEFVELYKGIEAKACNWAANQKRFIAARRSGYHLITSCY